MRRREFITLLGGDACVADCGARAATRTALRRIGWLGAARKTARKQWAGDAQDAFVQRLQANAGWTVMAATSLIEYRWLGERVNHDPSLCRGWLAELAGQPVSVLVATRRRRCG